MIEYCAVCGKRRATGNHHLIFGYGLRALADEDKLYIPICDNCHTVTPKGIHGNTAAEHLSKMLGQALWERDAVAYGLSPENARSRFVKRYGKSWL